MWTHGVDHIKEKYLFHYKTLDNFKNRVSAKLENVITEMTVFLRLLKTFGKNYIHKKLKICSILAFSEKIYQKRSYRLGFLPLNICNVQYIWLWILIFQQNILYCILNIKQNTFPNVSTSKFFLAVGVPSQRLVKALHLH